MIDGEAITPQFMQGVGVDVKARPVRPDPTEGSVS